MGNDNTTGSRDKNSQYGTAQSVQSKDRVVRTDVGTQRVRTVTTTQMTERIIVRYTPPGPPNKGSTQDS